MWKTVQVSNKQSRSYDIHRTRTYEDEDDDEAEALDDEEVRPGSVLDVLAEKDEDAADVVLSFRRRFGLYVFPATMQTKSAKVSFMGARILVLTLVYPQRDYLKRAALDALHGDYCLDLLTRLGEER